MPARNDKHQERIGRLRDMNANELHLHQRELAEQIFRLRFGLATGQAEGLKRLRAARKEMARLQTVLREMELKKAHG
jgi:large subunit ribosomal protein L29